MFEVGDRVVIINHSKTVLIITAVISDKSVNIKPLIAKNNLSFTVDSNILEYDFAYYRNKKINKILTKIK
jgi:hypothetical protein